MQTEQKASHGFSRLSSLFTIPEWMFTERPHLVSKEPIPLRYACQVCGLMEPRPVANGYIRRECACERAIRDDADHRQFQAETKALAGSRIAARTYTWLGADAGDDLEHKTFDNFTESYQPKAYQEARAWVTRFIQARQYSDTFSSNLLLTGGYGTGKTHLAAAILNTLRAQCIPCLFCTAQDLFNALYAAEFEAKQSLLEQASTISLLVIDDLDKLYVRQDTDGAYQKRTLFDILDKRYKRKLPTIITTNEQQGYGQWLDGATISRLYERITALAMNGTDYRSQRAETRSNP